MALLVCPLANPDIRFFLRETYSSLKEEVVGNNPVLGFLSFLKGPFKGKFREFPCVLRDSYDLLRPF
mgnify:CR=1 FL=1